MMVRALRDFFDIRPGEGSRLRIMAALLFLLIAANNLIKILRDSIFLGHHAVTELPYLYILVAFCAGVIIATYTRYTAHISLVRLILATNATVIVMIACFWWLLTYIDAPWSHYAFYIWSAMVSVIAVAQLWTLVNRIFSPDQGKRLFGLLTAGGTLGGVAAGFGSQWALNLSMHGNHLFFGIAAMYVGASCLIFTHRPLLVELSPALELRECFSEAQLRPGENVFSRLADSVYLKTIAAVILLSVIVSTLVDFELKAAAKTIYPSRSALALFFASYYGWLNVATLLSQVLLTGKTLTKLGIGPSLYMTPIALLNGVIGIMIWPGLIPAALTRIADATLRNSIHRSSMEVIYMGVPPIIMKAVKTFLDVVIERVGDASAGFIILALSLSFMASFRGYVHFICLGLILVWIVLIGRLRSGYAETVRRFTPLEETVPEASAATVRAKHIFDD